MVWPVVGTGARLTAVSVRFRIIAGACPSEGTLKARAVIGFVWRAMEQCGEICGKSRRTRHLSRVLSGAVWRALAQSVPFTGRGRRFNPYSAHQPSLLRSYGWQANACTLLGSSEGCPSKPAGRRWGGEHEVRLLMAERRIPRRDLHRTDRRFDRPTGPAAGRRRAP